MVSLRVPKRHHGGLGKFLSLPEEAAQELFSSLERSGLTLELRELLRNSVTIIEAIPASDTNSIADALVSLYLFRASENKPTAEFVDELSQAIEQSGSEELSLSDDARANIKSRLTRLLDIDTIVVAAKAIGTTYDYGGVFSKARVSTDIRPVFGTDTKTPRAAAIIHNLRIHYHHDDEHKDFFVAIDTQDIQKFIDVLERAKEKAESLKVMIAAANVPYIEPTE
jgi:hypothetical protein